MSSLNSALSGFQHHNKSIHRFGRAARQMLEPRLHVDNNSLVALHHYMAHQHPQQRTLGTKAPCARLWHRAQRDELYTLVNKAVLIGDVVNLGIGIPTIIADLVTPEYGLNFHTENGMLGVGPAPASGGALDYPVNAAKQPITQPFLLDGCGSRKLDEEFIVGIEPYSAWNDDYTSAVFL